MAKAALIAVWLAAAGAVGAIGYLGFELTRGGPVRPQPVSVERLPRRQPHNQWARWTVTEHLSAHHVLIAHVETDYLHEAVAIAQQIADPVKEKYAEVLIYFHHPGRPDTLPPRRVQWTAAAGYVETVYQPE